MWPQITMLCVFTTLALVSIIKHGEEDKSKYNAVHMIWNIVMFMLLLGAGGFWKPLGI